MERSGEANSLAKFHCDLDDNMQNICFPLNIIALFVKENKRCTMESLARFCGCFLWMLGNKAGGAEWYKVLAGGQVTFTLSEEWGVLKGPPPNSIVLGDAMITLEYLDGSTEQIDFQDSSSALWSLVAQDGYGLSSSFGTGGVSGTSVWTQTASLAAGTVFRIVLSSPAQLYDPQTPFQGSQSGAYVKGFVSKFSTDAPPVTPPSGPSYF